MTALGLHWISTLILIFATSALDSQDAYNLLVNLYSYVIVSLLGLLVSGGLLYLRLVQRKTWRDIADFDAWGSSPLPAAIYFGACGFLLFARIKEPSAEGLNQTKYPYWLVPVIGLSSLAWGLFWYGGLMLTHWIRKEELVVSRDPLAIDDPDAEGKYLMKAEVVKSSWEFIT